MWIKNSILSSNLPSLLLFSESDIDWYKCEEFALNNLVKIVAGLWNNGMTTKEISCMYQLSKTTIRKYLHKANFLNWCKYTPT